MLVSDASTRPSGQVKQLREKSSKSHKQAHIDGCDHCDTCDEKPKDSSSGAWSKCSCAEDSKDCPLTQVDTFIMPFLSNQHEKQWW